MVCYIVSLAALILVHVAGKTKKHFYDKQLELLLLGGATFGVVDHLWNGELFLISDNWFWDAALGFVITASIFLVWLAAKFSSIVLSRECEPSKNDEQVPE